MDTWYWIFEYGKVFCGYVFLMILWPSVVFCGHLREKTKTYRFSFCVTVQIVLINTMVLTLGLFHILHRFLVLFLFYGVFALALVQKLRQHLTSIDLEKLKVYRLSTIRIRVKEYVSEIWRRVYPLLREYGLLLAVIVYGMLYFSYGAFQVRAYGYGDLYAHHDWINGLLEGRIFSGGVYPAAMHCFIYCMNSLLGIRVYSILLFMQGIHTAVLFISVYILLRKIFYYKYTPVFVIMLFLTLDLVNADQIQSMFRLQITLPQEFCLHTVFLCAFYLIVYLKNTDFIFWRDRLSKCHWDRNLFLFMTSLAAAVMTHFHTTIMVFLICVPFAAFVWKKILRREYLIPLTAAVLCSCLIAAAPIAAALAAGIPWNSSINWAVNAMSGEESRSLREEKELPKEGEETEQANPQMERKEISITAFIINLFIGGYEKSGYAALYGRGRGNWIIFFTMLAVIYCWQVRRKLRGGFLNDICSLYPPVILASFVYVLVYEAPMLGLPDLIPEGRFFVPGHMMVLAVTMMPMDVLFSILELFCRKCILKAVSALSVLGIYGGALLMGNYRGFLFYELVKYSSAVSVTESIVDTFPRHSYTIVSPTDEIYSIIGQGWHEELLTFVEKCESEEYTLPSEYVFVYVEKRPLLYAQCYFLQGSSWLGSEKYLEPYWNIYSKKYPDGGASQSPEVIASETSEKEAGKKIPEYTNPWLKYTKLGSRTILESKAYEWCRHFSELYPFEMNVYYEDEDFVCYYFRQDTASLYNLALGME